MKHLAWNCRGLGNPRTVRELHLLVKEKSPGIIFLNETKCRRERIEKCSDHNPILIQCVNFDQEVVPKRKMFRYEVAWGNREGCKDLIKEVWSQRYFKGTKLKDTRAGLEGCRKKLQSWSKKAFRTQKRLLDQKRERLRRLQDSNTGQFSCLIKIIQKEIDELLEEEELKWRQRTKQRWLRDGDRNTKYFHRCATHRKQMNSIKVVTSEEGVREHSQEGIARVFQAFYQVLFSTSHPENIDEALQSVQPCVSEDMNFWLTKAFTEEEVTAAIKGMNPLGSPGPDGFPAVFYQQHWCTVGKRVTEVVLEALNSRQGLSDLNQTFISLIPKKKLPQSVVDFRPISLCNVPYKVVSKVIANRLKTILSNLISSSQSAFVLGRSKPEEWSRLRQLLSSYEEAIGQRLNIEKASIFFSRNTRREVQQSILQQAGLRAHGPFDKYLGLPSYIGKQRTKAFSLVVDRIKSKMASWKTKVLSQGGKEILLKFVLQSIPTYSMGIFKLPKSIVKNLNKLLQSFWWAQTDSKSKVHWLSWQTMGKPKDQGGLGFRDFEFFNLALLAKQGWRIIQNLTSVAPQVLKAKYFSGSSFLSAKGKASDSFVWRSFLSARHVLMEGMLWRVGDGTQIKVWKDKWLPSPSTFKVQSPVRILNAEATVAELINPDIRKWNLNLIHAIFSKPEAKVISKMTISQCGSQDVQTWRCSENGKFTIRSAYHLQGTMEEGRKGQCSSLNQVSKTWRKMWSLQAPHATKSFLWRAAKESLPTCLNLYNRKIVDSPFCPICSSAPESITHAIWSCSAAQDVWSMSSRRIQKLNVQSGPFLEVLKPMLENLSSHELTEVAVTARALWNRRNLWLFEQLFHSPFQVSKQIHTELTAINQWTNTRDKASVTQVISRTEWTAPAPSFYKANWDAAVNKENSKIGVGVVVRDSSDPLLGEAVATLKASTLCFDIGLNQVMLEGDSSAVVQVVQCRDEC
ncbi:uncharacterized protein LOC122301695 [Carya illinoinensis]|uniref:uncharacterized protein LOC122301695 n=1 Tax=Carya illinoinensis TaxID=32201 RepID=UPI001C71E05A|nr:uncharacterized protein LOC122301695 [Carya illinoinensis]